MRRHTNIRNALKPLLSALVFIATFAAAPVPSAASPLRVGDHVSVQVLNHQELSGERVVDSDGTVSIPLVGPVNAAGLVPRVFAAHIAASLKRYIPYVAVDVQRKSEGAVITVAGWPFPIPDGVLKYLPGQTLAGAIAAIRTGSAYAPVSTFDPYHSRINMHSVVVERDGRRLGMYDAVALAAGGESGPVLRPGDLIRFVNNPVAVHIIGAVKQPGYAYLAPDEPLADAIDQVGGMLDNASTSNLVLRRGDNSRGISVADADFHLPAANGDVLDVTTAPQVVVAGVVLKPGSVLLKNDASLLSAVFNAGGPDKDADLSHVRVVHSGIVSSFDITALTRGDMTQNPQLHDGDEVIILHGRRIDSNALASIISSLRWMLFR